jgi:hypothetical protein
MGARYYDAALGRFISADTIVASLANPQSLNRYSYVYNNPVNSTDPTGHMVISDDGGGVRNASSRRRATPTRTRREEAIRPPTRRLRRIIRREVETVGMAEVVQKVQHPQRADSFQDFGAIRTAATQIGTATRIRVASNVTLQ